MVTGERLMKAVVKKMLLVSKQVLAEQVGPQELNISDPNSH
jgi:hypothetical protein